MRVVRYIIGLIVAVLLLFFGLPLMHIPPSHFLPPAYVWDKANAYARGVVTSKYYDVTNDPFQVGKKEYHLNYQFRAKMPATFGAVNPGAMQTFYGTSNVDESYFDSQSLKGPVDFEHVRGGYGANELQPVPPGFTVAVKYEVTYPDINGIVKPVVLTGRNIGAGSNNVSGWLIYVLLALGLAYVFMMLFERFSSKENI